MISSTSTRNLGHFIGRIMSRANLICSLIFSSLSYNRTIYDPIWSLLKPVLPFLSLLYIIRYFTGTQRLITQKESRGHFRNLVGFMMGFISVPTLIAFYQSEVLSFLPRFLMSQLALPLSQLFVFLYMPIYDLITGNKNPSAQVYPLLVRIFRRYLVAAYCEEITKLVFASIVTWLWGNKASKTRQMTDIRTVAWGFEISENFLYGFRGWAQKNSVSYGLVIFLTRSLWTFWGHAAFSELCAMTTQTPITSEKLLRSPGFHLGSFAHAYFNFTLTIIG